MQIVLRPDVLREHIARRNLSQNCFALRAGISSSYMAQLLAGSRRPSAPMRRKLLDATGLDFDTLFRIVRTRPVRTVRPDAAPPDPASCAGPRPTGS